MILIKLQEGEKHCNSASWIINFLPLATLDFPWQVPVCPLPLPMSFPLLQLQSPLMSLTLIPEDWHASGGREGGREEKIVRKRGEKEKKKMSCWRKSGYICGLVHKGTCTRQPVVKKSQSVTLQWSAAGQASHRMSGYKQLWEPACKPPAFTQTALHPDGNHIDMKLAHESGSQTDTDR